MLIMLDVGHSFTGCRSLCPERMPCLPLQVVTVTGTTTTGKPLNPDNLAKALEGCAMAMTLDEDKRAVGGRLSARR